MKQIDEKCIQLLKIHNKYFLDKKKYDDMYSFFKESRYNINVLFEGKNIVAYCILYNAIDCYELIEIAVDENFRNKGLAKKLLNELPKDKEIFLEVSEINHSAIELYRNFGFVEISKRKRYYLDNTDAIIMKKNWE